MRTDLSLFNRDPAFTDVDVNSRGLLPFLIELIRDDCRENSDCSDEKI